ncbi:MAG TPA: type II toxin-antitoxin system VapC family toxin [Pseudonocardia sp.]|uniref:type II toxin-antitoxin system VapC family toxin n=1 Tax=Pseudonocardia sp. TaxID=60912 RepID=UPI002F3EAA1B
MKLLLDTNALLWWLFELPQLGPSTRRIMADADTQVFVSAISAAEIGVKQAVGKLQAPDDLERQVAANGFTPLPMTLRHGLAVGKLPLHHRDPFDRMMVAQAHCEGLTLATADQKLGEYDIEILPADK